MNASLYTGVLGLQHHQLRMDVIGNNIANINTFGFKRGRATFADMLSRTYIGAAAPRSGRGGVNPLQVGMGVRTISVTNIMTQGQLEMTGRLTDVAIEGNGWFILQDQSGDTVYTRDGAFGLDREGGLVNANGWYIQGWDRVEVEDDHSFTIDTTRPVDQIQFQYGQKMEAQATSVVGLKCNLDAETRSLIADGIDPREGYATRNDLLVDLYDAVTSTGEQYSPTHLGLREGDWIEIRVQVQDPGTSDMALTPIETAVYGYLQVTNDTDMGDLESSISNVLEQMDVYGTQNAQAVFNEDEGRFEIYNYDTSGQNDDLQIEVRLEAVSGSAIREGYILRESTYPTITGTRLYLGSGGPGMESDEVVGWADYQTGQVELDYGNIIGTPQVYGQLIQSYLTDTYALADAGVFGANIGISLGVWTGYTEGGTVRHILGTQTLTVDGNVWREVGATTGFTGAANEYILSAGAGSTPVVVFSSVAMAPASGASMVFQFRPNSTALNLLSSGTAYTLNTTTGLVTLNWDNSAATAELSGAVAYTGTVRVTANYTTEDRAMSAPASMMNSRWADFAQERTSVALGGSGKDRTDFNNMFTGSAGTGLIGAGNWIDNQTTGSTAPYNTSYRLGSAYVYRTSVTTFDSIGDDHELQFIFTHVGSNYDIDQSKRYENRWYWRAELPYSDVFGFDSMDDINSTNVTTRLNGQLEFDENGLIQGDLLSGNDGPIEFDPSPIGLNGVSTRAIETVSITADFDGDDVDVENGILREGITQMASPSTTHVFEQNGWEMGILETFSIDMHGIFEGRYSNNVVKPIAQIALAMFPNEEGLFKEGDNTFSLSANSGLASVQPATVGARGYVVGGSLEQSNVDITVEFTNMIITERGFQANSRIITTSDEMLTEVLNLKR